jgi:hypothetical protein
MKLFALTAFGLAGAAGIGVLSVRAMAASPTVAKPKSSCAACSMTLAVADCLQVTEVSTDQVLTLATLDGSTATLLNSSNTTLHAQAEFGKVNADGTYHAPLFVPPSGLDYVTILDTDDVPVARLMFQVKEGVTTVEPGVMNSGMATSAPVTASPAVEPGPGTSSSQGSTQTVIEEPAETGEVAPVSTDTPTTLNDVEAVTTVTTSLGQAYEVPMRAPVELGVEEPTIDEQIVVLSPVALQKGKKCGVFPKPTKAGQPCTPPGTLTVPGPWKDYRKGTPAAQTVSGGAWGISGTISFMAQDAVAVQYTDVYYCKNGVWTFDHTTKCTKAGVYRYGFSPYSAGAIIGTGYSFDAPPECKRM